VLIGLWSVDVSSKFFGSAKVEILRPENNNIIKFLILSIVEILRPQNNNIKLL
jgi:hypothetical protein